MRFIAYVVLPMLFVLLVLTVTFELVDYAASHTYSYNR